MDRVWVSRHILYRLKRSVKTGAGSTSALTSCFRGGVGVLPLTSRGDALSTTFSCDHGGSLGTIVRCSGPGRSSERLGGVGRAVAPHCMKRIRNKPCQERTDEDTSHDEDRELLPLAKSPELNFTPCGNSATLWGPSGTVDGQEMMDHPRGEEQGLQTEVTSLPFIRDPATRDMYLGRLIARLSSLITVVLFSQSALKRSSCESSLSEMIHLMSRFRKGRKTYMSFSTDFD